MQLLLNSADGHGLALGIYAEFINDWHISQIQISGRDFVDIIKCHQCL